MKAIGYIRVSTEEQAREGVSLAHQEEKVRAYAKLHEMTLVEVVADEGLSAKSLAARPGAWRVLEAAFNGEVDAVIVYKLDRLFRNAREALTTAEDLDEKGVALHSVTQSIDTKSAMGKFFFQIMAAAAEMERNLISERTRDALAHKKASGEAYNHAPYGWDVVDGRLVENGDEQHAIKIMTEWRARHRKSYQQIADMLNETGTSSKKGGLWHAQTVKNVLEAAAADGREG